MFKKFLMKRENAKHAKITKYTNSLRAFRYFRVFRILSLFFSLIFLVFTVCADELHLKDGRVIEAEEVWQTADAVWYRQGKVISSVPKSDVVRITKPKAANAAANAVPVPGDAEKPKPKITSSTGSTNKDSVNDEVLTRKVTRVILKDGTQIDADSVWEDTERIAYRLGKMQTFIERAEVKSILRDVTLTEEKMPADLKLRFSTGSRGLDQLILYNAARHQVDPLLIYFVMREESGFNHRAVSRVGARGLMQLMPATAYRLGVRNIHDPVQNVDAGARYLRQLLEMFNGDVNLALAAYNAGEAAVMRYGRRIPPYRETLNYVWRINAAYRRAVGQ